MGEWSYGRLRIQMNKAYDIGVESLSGSGRAVKGGLARSPSADTGHTVHSDKFDASGKVNVASDVISADVAATKSLGGTAKGGTFFLGTVGCQMNDHGSAH